MPRNSVCFLDGFTSAALPVEVEPTASEGWMACVTSSIAMNEREEKGAVTGPSVFLSKSKDKRVVA